MLSFKESKAYDVIKKHKGRDCLRQIYQKVFLFIQKYRKFNLHNLFYIKAEMKIRRKDGPKSIQQTLIYENWKNKFYI